ncbi:MAG: phosphoenolpyruvate synthase [Candidatus Shapirobacteria bacterium]|nr:phosphoenolpyruvate synthase [Candidatus Shapirobacteria bacterium]MDD5073709.1 phosphoenolpyruvate synthase [Candidatus Shapirobacteria bacterium]
MPAKNLSFIVNINQADKDNWSLVGDKGVSLGEISKLGLPVPPGIIITTKAYRYFLKENGLKTKITTLLENFSLKRPEEFQEISGQIRKLILRASMPEDLAWQIIKAYTRLGRLTNPLVAVRSSAVSEDLQSSFLNISGEANVVKKVQECWASFFEARGIFYRQEAKKNLLGQDIAVVIQKMIQAETAGVLFTADPTGKKKNSLIIEAVWGLGEYLVQGRVTPDQYLINFQTGKIIDKKSNSQKVYLLKRGGKNTKGLVPKKKINLAKLNDEEIKRLTDLAKKIHQFYFFPQEIEWAKDKNQFFILQSRPLTTTFRQKTNQGQPERKPKTPLQRPILEGIGASPGIISGPVKKIKSAKEIKKINRGDILVAPLTTPDFIPAMRLVGGIITDQGGQTSHAAIISRELSIPCVVGTKTATKNLNNNQLVTVDGNKGEIFLGQEPHPKPRTKPKLNQEKLAKIKTATKVYVNLSEPAVAKTIAQKPIDGVGLLRAEFMFAKIGTHPRALLEKKQEKIIIQELTDGLGKICRSFSPRPVVYRTSDFKTNEYRNLTGGEKYETEEENPLLGFRGASRYIADSQVFALELEAIKNVRNKKGLRNLWLMLPFTRTVEELIEVKKIIAAYGLSRGPSFKLWLMVETPANIINLKRFIEAGIDGISLGTNDLTMLILGIDRDNAKLNKLFDEADPAVLWAIRKAIKTCQKYQISSSICGQVVSDQPEIIQKLVGWGISSISVNPDATETAKAAIIKAEKETINHG